MLKRKNERKDALKCLDEAERYFLCRRKHSMGLRKEIQKAVIYFRVDICLVYVRSD